MLLPNRRNLPGLTGLRGVGALWVVAFHAQFGSGIPVARAGYLGVDLFFILSGFVLSYAHPGTLWGWAEYRRFLQTRFARIFPLHWAALLMVLLVVALDRRVAATMADRFGWPEFVASVFLIQNWGWGRPSPWNVPAWSLSTEWLVSIAFPLFLGAARRAVRPATAAICCAGCLAVLAGFLWVTGNATLDIAARAGIVRTVCEFAAGCFLYRVYAAGWASGGPGGNVAAAVACVLVATGLLAPQADILAVFGFAVAVLAAAQPENPLARLLSAFPAVFLGEISYSVYLLHWIPLQILNHQPGGPWARGGVERLLVFCAYLASVLIVSAATHRWIEIPARNWLRPARRAAPVRTGSGAGPRKPA